MDNLQIKQKLHHYIDFAQENQLQATYTLLQEKIEIEEGRINFEQYNKEIEAAEARLDAGVYYTHAEIKSMTEK